MVQHGYGKQSHKRKMENGIKLDSARRALLVYADEMKTPLSSGSSLFPDRNLHIRMKFTYSQTLYALQLHPMELGFTKT